MQDMAYARPGEPVQWQRFNRVAVDLLGRFMREDRSEYPCRVDSMSPGEISLVTAAVPREGEAIIIYIDQIGRLEGVVSQTFEGGFELAVQVSERKREKLAAQLTWFANRGELDLPEDRRHERLQPDNPTVDLVLDDGRRYQVRIIDLSLSGAAVSSSIRPAIGSAVTLGTTRGRVVRHVDEGFAIEFSVVRHNDSLLRNFP